MIGPMGKNVLAACERLKWRSTRTGDEMGTSSGDMAAYPTSTGLDPIALLLLSCVAQAVAANRSRR